MNTATMDTSALDQRIQGLQAEVRELEQSFETSIRQKYAEIAAAAAEFANSIGSAVPAPAAPPARTNGIVLRKKTPKGKAKAAKAAGRVSPTERNYENKVSLRQNIWNILSRGKALKTGEIKGIIEKEKLWQSNSDDINSQIQQHLHLLKKVGKVARNAEDHTYTIVKGATL